MTDCGGTNVSCLLSMNEYNVSVMAAFSRRVREYARDAPPTIHPAATCGEALLIMREFPASSIIITSHSGRPIGILTEQDVVRRITFMNTSSTSVAEVMTSPLRIIRDDDYLFHGIAVMQRFGLRHLPVVGRSGQLAGILNLHDALAGISSRMLDLIERLMHDETPEGLRLVKDAEAEVAAALLSDGIPAAEIQTLLTQINNDIYRRVKTIILNELSEEGWGSPPVEFDMIVMGSGGRGESFLFPDQDNGFILADYADTQHAVIDSYFMELAGRMSLMLSSVGFTICRGYVMAINPTWRKSLPQWCLQIDTWLEKPGRTTLRYVDIFFDFRHVSGREEFADRLRKHVISAISRNHVFLREMQLLQQDHGVALGRFGRLAPEQHPPHRGKLDLKYRGLLPLVEAVRLLALREEIQDTSTLGRLEALSSSGVVSRDEKDALNNAFQKLTTLILRQQIHDFRNGIQVSTLVSPASLSRSDKDGLIESLRAINELRGRVHAEFTGDVF